MDFLISEIYLCLLIAGLVGALLGWLFRGGCSSKIQSCEDEWKYKLSVMEDDHYIKYNEMENSLKSKLGDSQKELQLAKNSLMSHRNDMNSADTVVTSSQKENEELKNKLKFLENDLMSVREKLTNVEDERDEYKVSLDSVKENLRVLEDENESILNELKTIPQLGSKKGRSLGIMDMPDASDNGRLNDIVKERDELKESLTKKQQELQKIQNEFSKAIDDRDSLKNNLLSINNSSGAWKAKLEGERDELNKKLIATIGERDNIKARLADIEQYNSVLRDDLKLTRDESQAIKSKFAKLESEIDTYKNKYKNAENEAKLAKARIDDIEKNQNYVKNSLMSIENRGFDKINSEFSSVEKEIKSLKEVLKNAQNEQKSSKDKLAELEKQRDSLNKDLIIAKGSNENIKARLADVQKDNDSLKTDLKRAKEQKESLEKELEKKVSELNSEKELLQNRLSSSQNELKAKSSVDDSVDINLIMKKLAALEEDNKQLKKDLDITKKESMQIKNSLNSVGEQGNNEQTKLGIMGNVALNTSANSTKMQKSSQDVEIKSKTKDEKKTRAKRTTTKSYKGESHDIEDIEGIGPAYGRRLRGVGIVTTKNLLKLCKNNPKKVTKVAKDVSLKEDVIVSWTSMADFMRVSGVDGQSAELIQAVGINSLEEFSQEEASELSKKMEKFNKTSPIVPEVPSKTRISIWLEEASKLI